MTLRLQPDVSCVRLSPARSRRVWAGACLSRSRLACVGRGRSGSGAGRRVASRPSRRAPHSALATAYLSRVCVMDVVTR